MVPAGGSVVLERLFLVLTDHCNGRCRLCHYWKRRKKRYLRESFIRDRVRPLISRYGIRLVLLTGGEPTFHPRFPEIVKLLKGTGVQVSLITNGGRLEDVFDPVAGDIDTYMFSLDASGENLHKQVRGLDNFKEITRWPGRIKDRNPLAQTAFLCLLQKENVVDLVNLYRLALDLPLDALIFNVPELKPQCFGRAKDVPAGRAHACLSQDELALLKENLEHIQRLDRERGLLFQGPSFFDDCVRYFEALGRGRTVPLNDPRFACRAPFTSLVVDEAQRLYPCFYLPYHAPFQPGIEDPFDSEALQKIRRVVSADAQFRETHCGFCLQFQA
jgi:MoaA/NifB/PqqE/SkfB family radical SAM enzyme